MVSPGRSVAALLAVALAGCGQSGQPAALPSASLSPTAALPSRSPSPSPVVAASRRPDAETFLGVVTRVVRGSTWAQSPGAESLPAARGDGTESFTLGPGELVLRDGRRLRFQPGTPAGNSCLPFLTAAERSRTRGRLEDPCVVIGEKRRGSDAVLWFRVLAYRTEENAPAPVLGTIEAVEGDRAWVLGGAWVRVDPRVEVNCGKPEAGVDSVRDLVASGAEHRAFVSLETGRVHSVACMTRW